ncbi:MAG: four-carbon acid sugar kinase family protein [Pirellulales bacterium]|nr:four-carbon acid sugar kinase family protein [Pirellulales bacterium]
MNDLLLTYYGDDFTGSTDALDCLSRAGAETALFIEPPTPQRLSNYPGLRAIGVAGMTRTMTPDHMEEQLRPALAALHSFGAPHVHYKVCSTFDSSPVIGSIGRVIDLGRELFQGRFIPLLAGTPALGRYSVFGNLFARMGTGSKGPVYRLDRHPSMASHPITPMDESDLIRHLAKQTTKRMALFDLLQLSLPPDERRAELEQILADHPDVILFDILLEDHLECIGSLIDWYASADRPLFSIGSSGMEMALGAHWVKQSFLNPITHWPDPGPARPILVVSGSCSPVTEKQIQWGLAHGFSEVAMDTVALVDDLRFDSAIGQATSMATRSLSNGDHVIVHTSKGAHDPRIPKTAHALAASGSEPVGNKASMARLLGTALGHVIRGVLEAMEIRRICVAGGDTASYAARVLGIESLRMVAPISLGAPLCVATAPGSPVDGLELNFKGGQVGQVDFFEILATGSMGGLDHGI